MITIPSEVLEKINNPIQLPSNQGDPRIGFAIINGNGTGEFNWTYSDYVKSGTISSKLEDYSYSCSLTFIRGDIDLDEIGNLWVPGSKISVYVGYGTNDPLGGAINLFSGHIDEIDWESSYEDFTVSATGSIAHCLKQCSMGETITLTGLSHEVTAEIMDIAGVTDYYTTIGTYEWTYTYKPSDTCLTALEQMYPIFPRGGVDRDQPGFGILATPSDHIVFGYWRHRIDPECGGIPVENYIFDIGTDAFNKSTKIASDKCYSKVRATGKAADGVDLEPYTVNVINFIYWHIPENKIYHAEFNGYTMQDDLEDWAETIALELRLQGITDNISGPLRPQITVGDIASMTIGSHGRQGVITEITHHIGIDGFKTDFSIDSSGVTVSASGWSSNMKWNGYNRRQKLAETVHEIAQQVTHQTIDQYDSISIQDVWDPEEEEEKEIIPERNKTTIIFDGRSWQDLLPSDDEDPENVFE